MTICFLIPSAQADESKQKLPPSRESLSLADAVLRALKNNLNITISRKQREMTLTDIIVEQAKFDPTLNLGGRFDRTVLPLNRPIFGFGDNSVSGEPRPFDVNETKLNFGLKQKLFTGANYDVTYNPSRTFVSGRNTFLFNPGYASGLTLNISQPLLRDFGPDVNRTPIRIAQNNAQVADYVFLTSAISVISTVEQVYWELVFAHENLKVAQAALTAAERLVMSNRALAKAGIVASVEVLQAEAGVASRIEQVLIAEKGIRDQEDQVRRLLNPTEKDLLQDMRVIPVDQPIQTLEPISLELAKDIAVERRPEVLQALKTIESSEINTKVAKNQLLPSLALEGTIALTGLGSSHSDLLQRNFGGDFYNYGAGLVLSYPLGNRAAWGQYNKRQLEAENAQAALEDVRKQVIVEVKEAVRRVQTDFKRIETTQSARILADKQLEAEQERLKAGLSTTIFVLGFLRDVATARANELRATVDYNKSLSNLAKQKATTLERYNIILQ
ncbi:MAG: TolC family protein [Nitrospira sp.]